MGTNLLVTHPLPELKQGPSRGVQAVLRLLDIDMMQKLNPIVEIESTNNESWNSMAYSENRKKPVPDPGFPRRGERQPLS